MTDYTELDAAILRAIKNDMNPIYEKNVCKEANLLAAEHNTGKRYVTDQKPAFRFTDNRLQAMRKAGKIQFDKTARKWVAGNNT